MPKEELHAALMERIAEYRSLHPRTLDIDMRISEALSKGDTITKVSINTPCDISTVYRSIIRIEKFLQGETDNIDVLKGNYTVSNAIIQGRWTQRSLLGMKLYMCLLVLHQQRRNSAAYNTIRKYCPGLRNSKQRKVVLEELNNLSVLTYEENEKNIKIFEFVEYIDHTYLFELTEDAYPYYYPLYQLLGRHSSWVVPAYGHRQHSLCCASTLPE